jgi:hypothetical protein
MSLLWTDETSEKSEAAAKSWCVLEFDRRHADHFVAHISDRTQFFDPILRCHTGRQRAEVPPELDSNCS